MNEIKIAHARGASVMRRRRTNEEKLWTAKAILVDGLRGIVMTGRILAVITD